MAFFLLVCEEIPDVFSYSHFSFFISNITAICENKIPPSSESAMISKELENSNLSYFSANLTDIFVSNYHQILPDSCLQISSKVIIYFLVGTHNHFHNILRLFDVLPNYHFL